MHAEGNDIGRHRMRCGILRMSKCVNSTEERCGRHTFSGCKYHLQLS